MLFKELNFTFWKKLSTLSYVYYSNSTCSTQTSTTTGASATGKAPVDVGNYYVKATSAATSNLNSTSSSCVTHTITKGTPTISLTAKSAVYTGSAIAANKATAKIQMEVQLH